MRTRRIIAERPVDIPNDWVIMNAPRPLMGHKEWRGDFVCGVFYVAISPVLKEDHCLEFNESQDATILEYVAQQDVVDEMLAYYQARPKLWERLKDNDFDDPDVQDQLVSTWYNLEKNWRE